MSPNTAIRAAIAHLVGLMCCPVMKVHLDRLATVDNDHGPMIMWAHP